MVYRWYFIRWDSLKKFFSSHRKLIETFSPLLQNKTPNYLDVLNLFKNSYTNLDSLNPSNHDKPNTNLFYLASK